MEPPVDDNLTPDLLLFAAGNRRRPAYDQPPAQVATFLTTPLTAQVGSASTFDLHGAAVKTLSPLVERITTRDPSFAAHNAALQLAGLGKADLVTSYLSDEVNRGETIFQPLFSVGGETAADRQEAIQTLLPHLAALAGGDVKDRASHGILMAVNGLLAGTNDTDTIHQEIWRYKDYLPKEERADWIRRLGKLKQQLPEDHEVDLDKVGEAIMTCPE